MAEWHLDPLYICEHWSRELLNLMLKKMSERYKRQSGTASSSGSYSPDTKVVSDIEAFATLGITPQKTKKTN